MYHPGRYLKLLQRTLTTDKIRSNKIRLFDFNQIKPIVQITTNCAKLKCGKHGLCVLLIWSRHCHSAWCVWISKVFWSNIWHAHYINSLRQNNNFSCHAVFIFTKYISCFSNKTSVCLELWQASSLTIALQAVMITWW